MSARADRVASSQNAGPARRTLRLHVHVGETQTLACKFVDTWRRRTARRTAAIDAQFAITEVVDQYEQDVGLRLRRRRLRLRTGAKCSCRGEHGATDQQATAMQSVIRSLRQHLAS